MHPLTRGIPVLLALLAACDSMPEPRAAAVGTDTSVAVTVVPGTDTTRGEPPCAEPCRTRDEVAGDYVLVEMDGRPLPHTSRFVDPAYPSRHCTSVVDEGGVTLLADGTFRERNKGRIWCDDMRRGRFNLYGPSGDSIAMGITAIDPPIRLIGALAGDELRVVDVSEVETPKSAFRYVRRRP